MRAINVLGHFFQEIFQSKAKKNKLAMKEYILKVKYVLYSKNIEPIVTKFESVISLL